MKLFYSPTSPYARKVLIVVHERGLGDQLDLYQVDPWNNPNELLAASPLGRVPALVTDEGAAITESTTICEYLDGLGEHPSLLAPQRLEVLTRVGAAQGLMDATVTTVLERRRPPEQQWDHWAERQLEAIRRTLPGVPVPPQGRFDLGDISLASGLAYLDLRLSGFDWRELNSGLAEWFGGIAERPSMLATKPA